MNYRILNRTAHWLISSRVKTVLLTVFVTVAAQNTLASQIVQPPDSLRVIQLVTDTGTYYVRHEYLDRLVSEYAEKGYNCDSLLQIKDNKIYLRDSTLIARSIQLEAHQGIANVLNDEVKDLNQQREKDQKRITVLRIFSISGWMSAFSAFVYCIIYLLP